MATPSDRCSSRHLTIDPGRGYDSTSTTADNIGRDTTIGFSTVRIGRSRIVEFRTDGSEMRLSGS
jgi:hypothetical protein